MYRLLSSDIDGTLTGERKIQRPRQASESSGPSLEPGFGFYLNPEGNWDVKKIPDSVLKSAKFSGYLTIKGVKSSVFETEDGHQWAQKTPPAGLNISSEIRHAANLILASTDRVSGDILLLLKDLGVIESHLDEMIDSFISRMSKSGISKSDLELQASNEMLSCWQKAFPGESLDPDKELFQTDDPKSLLHEALHLIADPGFDLRGLSGSRSHAEAAIDEIMIAVLQRGRNKWDLAGTSDGVLSELEKSYSPGMSLSDFLDVLSKEPVSNPLKTRIRDHAIRKVRHEMKEYLSSPADNGNLGYKDYDVSHSYLTSAAIKFMDSVLDSAAKSLDTMKSDREISLKKFIRLLKSRLDNIEGSAKKTASGISGKALVFNWCFPNLTEERSNLLRIADLESILISDLLKRAECSKLRSLSDSDWQRLEGTDSYLIESINDATSFAESYGRDVDRIIKGIIGGSQIPAPIVLERPDGSILMVSGNARLMASRALGIRPSVLWINL